MGAEERISALEAELAELVNTVAARDARIAELEKLLEEVRRSGKRQAAPFSKGGPKGEPARPGRKKGKNHGEHGHRMAPAVEPDRIVNAPAPNADFHTANSPPLQAYSNLRCRPPHQGTATSGRSAWRSTGE